MVDTEKSGGRNPLVDAALEISLSGTRHQSQELDEMDEMRGPQTGYVRPGEAPPGPESPDGEVTPPAGSYESFMRMFGGDKGPGSDVGPGMKQG